MRIGKWGMKHEAHGVCFDSNFVSSTICDRELQNTWTNWRPCHIRANANALNSLEILRDLTAYVLSSITGEKIGWDAVRLKYKKVQLYAARNKHVETELG